MTLVDKIYSFRAAPPFDRLSDAELTLIAEIAAARNYAPGAIIQPGNTPFRQLLLLVQGGWQGADGQPLPPILGLDSLLFGLPAPTQISAAPDTGAQCLLVERGHFFTIIYECPEFLRGFLESGARTAGGRSS